VIYLWKTKVAKKAIFQGLKIGAIVGFVFSFLYAAFVLIYLESILPSKSPQTVVIFTKDFFYFVLPPLLFISPVWLILPTFLGSITSGILSFVIVKFQPSEVGIAFICILLCMLEVFPFLLLYKEIVDQMEIGVYLPLVEVALRLDIDPFLALNLILLIPSMIFVFTGCVTGQYLNQRIQFDKPTSLA
jgi:hypothetical protein